MIEPNMATMLVYFFTNLNVPTDRLSALVKRAVDATFNSISVDTDTSTSDSLVLFSTVAAGVWGLAAACVWNVAACVRHVATCVRHAAASVRHGAASVRHAAASVRSAAACVWNVAACVRHAAACVRHAAACVQHAAACVQHAAACVQHAAACVQHAAACVELVRANVRTIAARRSKEVPWNGREPEAFADGRRSGRAKLEVGGGQLARPRGPASRNQRVTADEVTSSIGVGGSNWIPEIIREREAG
jgi:hypothetical protein